jgi:hypothetical protein
MAQFYPVPVLVVPGTDTRIDQDAGEAGADAGER